jgi:hypothetical protein
MEQFGARSTCPRETCLAEVEQSDVYVGIIAFRLGSLDPETKRSFTELEYEHAVKAQKDIRIYLAEEDTTFPANVIDKGDHDIGRLTAFKEHLRRQHTIASFSSKEDLVQKLRTDFEQFLPSKDRPEAQTLKSSSTVPPGLLRSSVLRPHGTTGQRYASRSSSVTARTPRHETCANGLTSTTARRSHSG